MGEQLTVLVEARDYRVPVRSLLRVLGDVTDMLSDIDASVSNNRSGSVSWLIEDVSLINPMVVTLVGVPNGDADNGIEVVHYAIEGLREVERGTERIPRHFTVHTLEKAKDMTAVLADGVQRVTLARPGGESLTVSQHLAANAEALLPKEYDELGTIRGKLESLDIHQTYGLSVWDILRRRRIECHFPPEIYETACGLMGRRVDASGKIRYSQEGVPIRMHVERMRVLSDHDAIGEVLNGPPMDITGGIDPVEYVRKIRDAY